MSSVLDLKSAIGASTNTNDIAFPISGLISQSPGEGKVSLPSVSLPKALGRGGRNSEDEGEARAVSRASIGILAAGLA